MLFSALNGEPEYASLSIKQEPEHAFSGIKRKPEPAFFSGKMIETMIG